MPAQHTRSLTHSSSITSRNDMPSQRRSNATHYPYASSVAASSCRTLVDDKSSAYLYPIKRSLSTISGQSSSTLIAEDVYLSDEPSPSPYAHPSPLGRAARVLQSFQYSIRLAKTPSPIITPLEECAAACYMALEEHGITKTSSSLTMRYPYVMPLPHFIHHVFSATCAPMKVIIHTIVLIMRRLRSEPQSKTDMVAYSIFTRAFMLATSLALPAGINHISIEYWSRLTGYSDSMIKSFRQSEELFKYFSFKIYPASSTEKQRLRRKTRLSLSTMLHPGRPLWPQAPPVCKPTNKPVDFVKDQNGCNVLKQVERWVPAWQMGSPEFSEYVEREVEENGSRTKSSRRSLISSTRSVLSSNQSLFSSGQSINSSSIYY